MPMNRIWSIYIREIHHLFDGLLAYLCIAVFLLFVGGFTLFFQDILMQPTTSMQPLFFWSSVGFLFLIPALSMASFAEENRTGSIEILMTLPLKNEDIVVGKYAAILSVVFLALILTFPYPLVVAEFGTVDWGAIFCGYVRLFLLGCSYHFIHDQTHTFSHFFHFFHFSFAVFKEGYSTVESS